MVLSTEKLLGVMKDNVPSEDDVEENPVVAVFLDELFVKGQPSMTKSVSETIGTCHLSFPE